MNRTIYTLEEWKNKGTELFGSDIENWKFKCPNCGHVASGKDFKEAGAEPNAMYCECIGRYKKNVGCDWAAYGLFDICNVHVLNGDNEVPVFDFAEGEENDWNKRSKIKIDGK